jgi:hypothetical protein
MKGAASFVGRLDKIMKVRVRAPLAAPTTLQQGVKWNCYSLV